MRGLLALLILPAGMLLGEGKPAVAAETHLLRLTRTMVVAGVSLRPADYNLQWEIHDKQATVKFITRGRMVATVQGELLDLGVTPSSDTLYFSKHPDGFLAINGLGLAGRSESIIFPAYGTRRRRKSNDDFTQQMQDSFRSPLPESRPLIYR